MSTTKFSPMWDYVVLKLDEAEEVSQGGIVLPTVAQKTKDPVGTVLAVGPNVEHVKAGQRVLFEGFMAKDVPNTGDDEVVMVKESHCIAHTGSSPVKAAASTKKSGKEAS